LQGAIDAVFIFDRFLENAEVHALYNATLYQYYFNGFTVNAGNHTFVGHSVDQLGNRNQTDARTIQDIANGVPTTPTPLLSTTGNTNQSNQDLRCLYTLADPNNHTMNVSVRWFNNSVLHLHEDYNNTYANGTAFLAILGEGNTTRGQNWTCSLRAYDGIGFSAWGNSSNLTVLNTPPVVALQYPQDGSSTTNRTPFFNWTVSDHDGDTAFGYEFNISLVASSTCVDPDRYVQNLVNPNYTLPDDLNCFIDNNDYYEWTVRSNDSFGFGSWASAYQLNISTLVDISLLVSGVDFGSLAVLEIDDTVDDSPPPFVVQNNGNAKVHVNISATALWTSVAFPSVYYQYKIDNVTTELNSFNWSGSVTTYTNMPELNVTSIWQLGYIDTNDSAETDILIQVPPNEPPGSRNSTVTFISQLAEGT